LNRDELRATLAERLGEIGDEIGTANDEQMTALLDELVALEPLVDSAVGYTELDPVTARLVARVERTRAIAERVTEICTTLRDPDLGGAEEADLEAELEDWQSELDQLSEAL
jgi:hypothetical protein